MPETASVGLPAAGEEGPQPRRRGLPRRVRRHARGRGHAHDQPADACTSASRCTSCASTARARSRACTRTTTCPCRWTSPGSVEGQIVCRTVPRAVGVRRAEPHHRALPVHRHPGRDVLVLDPDRDDLRRRVLDHRRRAVRRRPVVPRPRDAEARRLDAAPTSRAAAGPPPRSRDRWQGKAWPSARVHMHMFSPLPRGAFPGVDDNEVYAFLDRHA